MAWARDLPFISKYLELLNPKAETINLETIKSKIGQPKKTLALKETSIITTYQQSKKLTKTQQMLVDVFGFDGEIMASRATEVNACCAQAYGEHIDINYGITPSTIRDLDIAIAEHRRS